MRKIYLLLPLSIILMISLIACGDAEESQAPKQQPITPQAISLLGDTLYEPIRPEAVQKKLAENLAAAKANYESNPNEEMNIIWYGRRMAYLSRYQKAIDIYSEGLQKFPQSYKLLRHRGHRYISLRQFDRAIDDLKKAAELAPLSPPEIEPDGIPNKLNLPLSSTQFNIWYHLGLAYYLKQDFNQAREAYQKCMNYSINDDLVCATVDWYYMTLRRLGQRDEAEVLLALINDQMEIIENDSYFKRLQMYQGQFSPEEVLSVSENQADKDLALATQGYGVGNWYLTQGDTTRSMTIFRDVVAGEQWAAFGYIAAEADIKYLRDE
jgi:tetratricopeptide (TPR) repeat protein